MSALREKLAAKARFHPPVAGMGSLSIDDAVAEFRSWLEERIGWDVDALLHDLFLSEPSE